MLKSGSHKISSVYVGSQKIKRAYLGSEIVFQEKPSRLPAGYTEVEYIQKPLGKAYFHIPACSETVEKVTLDIDLISSLDGLVTNQCFCGNGYYSSATSRPYYSGFFEHYRYGIQSAVVALTSQFKVITTDRSLQRMSFVMDLANAKASCNDDELALPSISSSHKSYFMKEFGIFNTYPIQLSTKVSQIYLGSQARLYRFTREGANGALINELVPCINPSGIVGLYDLARASFISPTTGTFTAGPAV